MLTWNQSIEIQAPIEKIWAIFQSEDRQRIMPQVVKTKLMDADEENRIYTYEQTYQEGKRQESYALTEKILEDSNEEKAKSFAFTIGGMIHTEATFRLTKLGENLTKFQYSGANTGKAFIGKMMLKMASNTKNDKTVEDFLLLVKKESEK